MTMVPITQAVHVIRSKNAGPYELTLDVIFKTRESFEATRKAGIFTKQTIAKLYGVAETDILKVVHFEPAQAIKITLNRPMTSGSFGETDVYGAQQHAPLLGMVVPDH